MVVCVFLVYTCVCVNALVFVCDFTPVCVCFGTPASSEGFASSTCSLNLSQLFQSKTREDLPSSADKQKLADSVIIGLLQAFPVHHFLKQARCSLKLDFLIEICETSMVQ